VNTSNKKLMKKIDLLIALALTIFPMHPVLASGTTETQAANASAPNNAVNTTNSSVNQSPVGGVNYNQQFNNSQDTDYGFAPGIYCRAANISIGTFASGFGGGPGYSGGLGGYGAVAALTVPIGGSVGATCASLAKEIELQRQIGTCVMLQSAGVEADPEYFPDLAQRCRGIRPIKK
jgi:hypothetical protein